MNGRALRFRPVLDGFLTGHLNILQAHALAKEDPPAARESLLGKLQELRDPAPDAAAHWPANLLELVWRLDGPTQCVHHHFPAVHSSLLEKFYEKKLRENPDVFSDNHLVALRTQFDGRNLASLVIGLQSRRLKPKADALLGKATELSKDVAEVKKYVSHYSFNPDLNALLDKVEEALFAPGDGFDQAANLKHLRTFFEKLHQQAAEQLWRRKPETVDGTDLTKCQQVIDMLHRKNVLTVHVQALGRAIYGMLSNEGVHAIKSEREAVRLCRNFVAEYALFFFHGLDARLK